MGLKDFYYSLEDKYYAFMDGLQEKGLKVYEYFIDPIENRGLPSFPFFCVLLLAFVGVLAFGVMTVAGSGFPEILPPASSATATLSVKVTSGGQLLEGIPVVLDSGTDRFTEKTVEGIAVFKGVPVGKKLGIRVDQDGYESYSGSALIAKGKSRDYVEFELKSTANAGEIYFAVKDSDGNPISGATVIYRDSKGNRVSGKTNGLGQLPVEFTSRADVFSVSVVKDGYEDAVSTCLASEDLCEVTLDSKSKVSPEPEQVGTVTIKLINPAGDDVEAARVTLRHADTGNPLDEDLSDSLGNVKFRDAVSVGTPIYVTVKADGFEPYESDTQTAGLESEFLAQLTKLSVTPGPGGVDQSQIRLEVADVNKNPLEGADLRVFVSNKPLRELDQLTTDVEGKASFDASPTTEVFVTAFKEGYLPGRSRMLKGGSFELITLQRIVVGNSGSLKIQVLNEEGTPVDFSSVTLLDKDGFYLGIPRQDTGADGTVTFTGLPLKTVRAIATFEAQKGEADLVEIGTEEKSITIRLKPADAFISAIAKETGSKNLLNATFTAFKFSDNGKIGSCTSNKVACTLTVPANTNVYLKVASAGFVPATTGEFTVPAEQTVKREVLLLDATLSSQLKILDARVENTYGFNETFVNPGRNYQFRFSFNLPSGLDDAGVYFRIGTKSDLADEPALFVSQSGVTSDIIKGTRYNPGTSCADDAGADRNFKWLETRFKEFGSKSVSAKIFVKPTATEKDELVIQYRIFGKKAGTVIRQPADATFGEKERTDDLDSCYAKTETLRLPVRQGFSSCNEQACISAAFFDEKTASANGFLVNLDSGFGLLVNVRAFSPLNSPFLDLDLDKPLRATRHEFESLIEVTPPATSVKVPLSFIDETSGAFGLKAVLPSRNAVVKLTFGDASGTLHQLSRYVVVQGTGQLTLTANPLSLKTNKDNSISLTVRSANNQAIDDAKITLKEKKGAPFDGFPSGSETLLGDGSENLGKDGLYRFQTLRPTSVGDVAVVVTRDGFAEQEKVLPVVADEALEFDRDPSLVELSCTEKNTLQVTNRLNSELKVTGTFSGTSCAKIQVIGGGLPTSTSSGSSASATAKPSSSSPTPSPLAATGTQSISFKIKPGDKVVKLIVTPTSPQAQCVLLLNSETLTGISAGPVQDVWFSSTCEAPSPSPNTVGGDCASRGGICTTSSSCPAGYVASSGGQAVSNVCGSGSASASNCNNLAIGQSCTTSTYTGVCVSDSQSTDDSGRRYCYCKYGSQEAPATSSAGGVCENGGTCCVPTGQTSPSPSPSVPPLNAFCPRPNFGQLLQQQLLGYNLNNEGQAIAALTAPTVLVIDPAKGIEVIKATGCTQSGSKVTCEKPLYTLLPTNAMAFSIVNRLGVTTDVLVNPNNQCFDVREVGGSGDILSAILSSQIKNSVQSFAGLQRNQYRTYTITFMPKTGCVEFDGKRLQLAGPAKNGFTMRLESRTVIGGGSAELTFMPKFVDHATDAYSLVAMPSSGKIVLRGTDGATFEEPAYFGHNVLSGKLTFTVSGSTLAKPIPLQYGSLTPATLLLNKNTPPRLGLSIAESSGATVSEASVDFVSPVPGLEGFDVVGNVQSEADCGGSNYCTPEAAKAYVSKVEEELNNLYDSFTGSLDTVSMDNQLASPQAQQTIYRDAANAYAQMLMAYEQCLQQVCSGGAYGQPGFNQQAYNPNNPASTTASSSGSSAPSTPPRPPECDQISGAIPAGQNPYTYPYGGYGAGGYAGAYPNQYGGQYGGYSAAGYAGGYGNPYSSNGYYYPNNLPLQFGAQAAINDASLYPYLRQPGFSQAFHNTPYMSGLYGQNPLYRSSFGTNPNFANLNSKQGTEPILKLSHEFVLPVKVAGSKGGILQYKYKTDLNAIGKGKWVTIDTVSAVPYAYVTPITFGSSGRSSSSGTSSSVSGGDGKFPYLRLRPNSKNYYELVNWLKGIAAPTVTTTAGSGVQVTRGGSTAPVTRTGSEAAPSEPADDGTAPGAAPGAAAPDGVNAPGGPQPPAGGEQTPGQVPATVSSQRATISILNNAFILSNKDTEASPGPSLAIRTKVTLPNLAGRQPVQKAFNYVTVRLTASNKILDVYICDETISDADCSNNNQRRFVKSNANWPFYSTPGGTQGPGEWLLSVNYFSFDFKRLNGEYRKASLDSNNAPFVLPIWVNSKTQVGSSKGLNFFDNIKDANSFANSGSAKPYFFVSYDTPLGVTVTGFKGNPKTNPELINRATATFTVSRGS